MKKSKRNLIFLAVILGAVFYGTSLVITSTAVPVRQGGEEELSGKYLRSLKVRIYELVEKKQFAEAEIIFRRIRKLEPGNKMILRLGSLIFYRNGKISEAENLLRSLLLRDPGDHICRNNYAVCLMKRKRIEAVKELEKAWQGSGRKNFIGRNLQISAAFFNVKLPYPLLLDKNSSDSVPADAITLQEEKQ